MFLKLIHICPNTDNFTKILLVDRFKRLSVKTYVNHVKNICQYRIG